LRSSSCGSPRFRFDAAARSPGTRRRCPSSPRCTACPTVPSATRSCAA
jgi:hypothetical protein